MPKTTEELYKELLEQGKQYQQQANDYLSAYDNRGQFSYDAENDPMYQSLKNQYVHQGRRAMEDTMGQAAGLTGGYGSTYAQGVGNQAYNEYLTQLNGQIAGLAQQARANWDAEGDRMLDRYNLALNAANTAYGQARDALGDLRYDKEYADSQAYQQWQMNRADQSDARSYAEMMIKMGLMPSSDVLAAAGWSEADVKRMVDYYKQMQAASASGGRYSSDGSKRQKDDTGDDDSDGVKYVTTRKITPAQAKELMMMARGAFSADPANYEANQDQLIAMMEDLYPSKQYANWYDVLNEIWGQLLNDSNR